MLSVIMLIVVMLTVVATGVGPRFELQMWKFRLPHSSKTAYPKVENVAQTTFIYFVLAAISA
jgi:hypothetical protein